MIDIGVTMHFKLNNLDSIIYMNCIMIEFKLIEKYIILTLSNIEYECISVELTLKVFQ